MRVSRAARLAPAVVGLLFVLGAPAHPQPLVARADEPPPGLEIVWRVDGRELRDAIGAWSLASFSADGSLVAIADEAGVRVRRTSDGALERMFWYGFVDRTVYSLGVSSSGAVAVGRVGGVNLHASEHGRAVRYDCMDACGPVGALAFSPDGALLAFQGARSRAERLRGRGTVNVLDLRDGTVRGIPDAIAARARLRFSRDGTRLLGAVSVPFDDHESFGIRVWNVADWRVADDVPGLPRPARFEGRVDRTDFAAVYERDGRVELRDLATGAELWSVPLIPPPLDRPADGAPTRLRLLEIAPAGDFLLTYEVPSGGGAVPLGAIVIRGAPDGAVVAMYDVPDVTSLAIAPDGETFVYTTGSGRTYTALARVPR